MGSVKAIVFLLAVVSCGVWADAPADPTDPSKPYYDIGAMKFLMHSDAQRAAQILLEDAKSEAEIATEREAHDIQIAAMRESLFKKNAVSEDEFRKAQMLKDVAVAMTRVSRDKVNWIEHSVGVQKIGVSISAGAPVNVTDVYNQHRGIWEAQCRLFKSEVLANEAKDAYAKWNLDTIRKLRPSGSATLEDEIDAKLDYKVTQEKLKKSRSLDLHCQEVFPTLDDVRKIIELQQKDPKYSNR